MEETDGPSQKNPQGIGSPSSSANEGVTDSDGEVNINALIIQNRRLLDEKRNLEIKAKSVDVLTDLLEQSQREAADLRRQKQELLRSKKLFSSQSSESELNDMLLKYTPPPTEPKPSSTSPELQLKSTASEDQTLSLLSCSSNWTSADAKNLEDIATALDNLESTLSQCLDSCNSNEEAAILEQLEALPATIPECNKNRLQQWEHNWIDDLTTRLTRLKVKLNSVVKKKSLSLAALHEEIRKGKSEIKALQQRVTTPVSPSSYSNLHQTEEVGKIGSRLSASSNVDEDACEMISVTDRHDSMSERPKLKKMAEVQFEPDSTDETTHFQMQARVTELEGRLEELLAVNHIWDQQYQKLQGQMANELQKKDNEIASLRWSSNLSDINSKLSEKESIIMDLRHQMKSLQVTLQQQQQQQQFYGTQGMEQLQRREAEAARRCELANRLYSDQLDHLRLMTEEKNALQVKYNQVKAELSRLTRIIEASSSEVSFSCVRGPSGSSTTAEEIDLYKEQIKCYESDFKLEREEKSKTIKKLEADVVELQNKATETARELTACKQELMDKNQQMKRLVSLQRQRSDIDKQLSAYSAELHPLLPASPPEVSYNPQSNRDWMIPSSANGLLRPSGFRQSPVFGGSSENIYEGGDVGLPASQTAQRQHGEWRETRDATLEHRRSPVPRGMMALFPPWEHVVPDGPNNDQDDWPTAKSQTLP